MAKLNIDNSAPAVQPETVPAEAGTTVTNQIDGTQAVDAAAETQTEKKLSPKNKASRGIDPSLVTTWVPFDHTKEENERIAKVVAVRSAASEAAGGPKLKVGDVLQEVLKHGLTAYKEIFDAEAAKYVAPTGTRASVATAEKIAKMTPDEAEKYAMSNMERAQKQAQAAADMLAALKAKRQAAEQAALESAS